MKDQEQKIEYRILTLDLGVARTKYPQKIPGYNMNILTLDGSATLRLNHVTADAIDLTLIDQIQSKFARFYLTNTAQSGKTLILAIGQKNFKLINDPIPGYQDQPDAVLNQANPVSGTKYTVLDTTKNARIISMTITPTWTVQPDPIQIHVTIDGQAWIFQHSTAVSATPYETDLLPQMAKNEQGLVDATGGPRASYRSFTFEGKSVKVEVETTGGTVSNLSARVKWAKKVKR